MAAEVLRKPLISGNWKMHHNHFEAIQTVQKLAYLLHKDDYEVVDVSVHPPFTDIRSVQTVIDADELAAFGSGIEIAERLAAGQRFPKRERPASSGRGGVVRWGPTPAIPIDRARTTAP